MRLSEDLSRIQREYSEKRSQFLEGHPEMKRLAGQVEKTRLARATAVQQAYNKRLEAARAELNAASAREASTRGAYGQQRNEAQRLNVDTAGYLDLRMAVETKQTLLAQLQKQLSETEVSARLSGAASSNIHVIESAALPGGRHNLSMQKNLQSAFPLGLILGFAAIFFLEYMDRSIKNPEELEKVTQFASLGVIPSAASMSSRQYGYGQGYGRSTPRLRAVDRDTTAGVELIPHTDARSPIAEAYRAFRTSLLLASASSPKVIVITSAW
jgi:hypothetical protein